LKFANRLDRDLLAQSAKRKDLRRQLEVLERQIGVSAGDERNLSVLGVTYLGVESHAA
jgi:hypothetical protein